MNSSASTNTTATRPGDGTPGETAAARCAERPARRGRRRGRGPQALGGRGIGRRRDLQALGLPRRGRRRCHLDRLGALPPAAPTARPPLWAPTMRPQRTPTDRSPGCPRACATTSSVSGARTTTCLTAWWPRSIDCATKAVAMVAAAEPMATPTMVPLTPKIDAMTAAHHRAGGGGQDLANRELHAKVCLVAHEGLDGTGDELAGPRIEDPVVAETGDGCGKTGDQPEGRCSPAPASCPGWPCTRRPCRSSVSVAVAHDVPADPGSHQHGRLDVLDRHAEPHQVGHRWLHLAAPLLARRERDGLERPQPRPPRAVLGHVADQTPHLRPRQRQLVWCTVVMVPWISLAGPVPASSALTPRRARRCAGAGGRSRPPGSTDARGATMMARCMSSVLHEQLYSGHGRSDLGIVEVHGQHR